MSQHKLGCSMVIPKVSRNNITKVYFPTYTKPAMQPCDFPGQLSFIQWPSKPGSFDLVAWPTEPEDTLMRSQKKRWTEACAGIFMSLQPTGHWQMWVTWCPPTCAGRRALERQGLVTITLSATGRYYCYCYSHFTDKKSKAKRRGDLLY